MIQNLTIIRTDVHNCRCGRAATTTIQPLRNVLHMCQVCADHYAEGYALAIEMAHSMKKGN